MQYIISKCDDAIFTRGEQYYSTPGAGDNTAALLVVIDDHDRSTPTNSDCHVSRSAVGRKT